MIISLRLFAPARALAQPSDPLTLTWTAPSECPRAEDVRARMRKLAGPMKAATVPLDADAKVTRLANGEFHLRLVVRAGGEVGERNIDGKSCKALAGAAAVALILLLHAEAPLNGAASSAPSSGGTSGGANDDAGDDAASSTRSATVPEAPKAERPAPSGPDPSDASHHWHVLLQAPVFALGIGPLHQPSYGLAAGAGLSFDRWRFLLRGTKWFSQHLSGNDGDLGYQATIDRLSATLLACHGIMLSRFEIAPCLSVSLEHLSATGGGAYVAGRTDQASWMGLGAAVNARFSATSWLSLVLGIGAELQTSQPRLALRDMAPFENLLPAALTITVGPEWIL